jgi:hypothetical protein
MITGGKGSGSGKYSYHQRCSGEEVVMVTHMPEDKWNIRIANLNKGQQVGPVVILDEQTAEMLWACLNDMAKDLQWEDFK